MFVGANLMHNDAGEQAQLDQNSCGLLPSILISFCRRNGMVELLEHLVSWPYAESEQFHLLSWPAGKRKNISLYCLDLLKREEQHFLLSWPDAEGWSVLFTILSFWRGKNNSTCCPDLLRREEQFYLMSWPAAEGTTVLLAVLTCWRGKSSSTLSCPATEEKSVHPEPRTHINLFQEVIQSNGFHIYICFKETVLWDRMDQTRCRGETTLECMAA